MVDMPMLKSNSFPLGASPRHVGTTGACLTALCAGAIATLLFTQIPGQTDENQGTDNPYKAQNTNNQVTIIAVDLTQIFLTETGQNLSKQDIENILHDIRITENALIEASNNGNDVKEAEQELERICQELSKVLSSQTNQSATQPTAKEMGILLQDLRDIKQFFDLHEPPALGALQP